MILGIFTGTTVSSIRAKVQRIDKLKQAVKDSAAIALADRTAAIEEIRNEILEISNLRAQLKD